MQQTQQMKLENENIVNVQNRNTIQLIDRLAEKSDLPDEDLLSILNGMNAEVRTYLHTKAREIAKIAYQGRIFARGLIEFTNICARNCRYCGIRRDNSAVERYRLSLDDILGACETGHALGYRTFVLQGGEDPGLSADDIVDMVVRIKERYPDCALTLSIGEWSKADYKSFYDAGADRYLLRHETASRKLYESLHPDMDFDNRRRCLADLKEIGFQVGAGFMVGLPGQTHEDLVADLRYMRLLEPHMVGIGPFIPHQATPLAKRKSGTLLETLDMVALTRLMLPEALLPATTALGSIDPTGREMGLKAGANVVMPNLTPKSERAKYLLYDGKICVGDEAAECRKCIEGRIKKAGFQMDMAVGDHPRCVSSVRILNMV